MKKFYSEYQGIWYRFDSIKNTWTLSDNEYGTGNLLVFSGSTHRIDQCIETFKAFLQENKNKYRY